MAAIPITPQTVSLGENVKMLVSWADIVLKLSFEQIKHLLRDLYHISISDGEISHILEQQARVLLPHYHQLKVSIRGQPGAHYDETTYPVQQEEQGKYAWLMTGTKTEDTVFQLGQSRGKGNAEKLKDKAENQVA